MESMNTEQLIGWNRELSTLLCMPVEDRENLGWQIAVGDHLEKFAQSWHSSRIAELEAQIVTLQEIAIEERAKRIYKGKFRSLNFELPADRKNHVDEARRQLRREHPEAFR